MDKIRPIAVGDRVTGRCTTMQHQVTGTVAAILYPLGLHYFTETPNDRPHQDRCYVLDTGTYVECAERLDP